MMQSKQMKSDINRGKVAVKIRTQKKKSGTKAH
jgi:hypothetical protein